MLTGQKVWVSSTQNWGVMNGCGTGESGKAGFKCADYLDATSAGGLPNQYQPHNGVQRLELHVLTSSWEPIVLG